MKKSRIAILIVVLAAILLWGGVLIGQGMASKKYDAFIKSIKLVTENDPAEPFVHPILSFNSSSAESINQFDPLVTKIKQVADDHQSTLDRYSVYFRDLSNGLWVGINEDDKYNPASLLKISLAIATYKEAEANPAFLDEQKVYTPELAAINTENPNNDKSELVVGNAYDVKDLVRKMLVDSDNGAKDILGNVVDKNIINEAYSDLGVPLPSDTGDYYISARVYTRFFRALYGATNLDEAYSNEILALLSEAHFDKGLVAGVPNGVQVSHKYGEYVASTDNVVGSLELHDCGIVYAKNNPYVLCVMSQGKSEDDLASFIADVSKSVYQEVQNDYK